MFYNSGMQSRSCLLIPEMKDSPQGIWPSAQGWRVAPTLGIFDSLQTRDSIVRVFAGMVLLATLSGCETDFHSTIHESVPPTLAGMDLKSELATLGGVLLDGFEGPEHTLWAFDAADDEATAKYIEDGATQGKIALQITVCRKGSKGKINLRRDVELNLSHASALLFDLSAPVDKLSAALAFKCAPGDVYQESEPIVLTAGLNRNVRFALDSRTWKSVQSKWEYNKPLINVNAVTRIMLLLFTENESSGSFLVDNLRVEGESPGKDSSAIFREWRPEILLMTAPPPVLSQFKTMELNVVFRASYRDVFDAQDILFGSSVTTPSGKNIDVCGFFAGFHNFDQSALSARGVPIGSSEHSALPPFLGPEELDTNVHNNHSLDAPVPLPIARGTAAKGMVSLPVWTLRFTPRETGRYTMRYFVRNKVGETATREEAVVVGPEISDAAAPGCKGGNVRVSRSDSRLLELQDGSPFFIFGQNVCWTQDWTPYLKKIQAYGGNTCRIWLCPWGLNLERKINPGTFDLAEAERMDRLMTQAESSGVRIIFCFTSHGATADFWHDSSYNQANGGPCARPQDFFTDARARRQFKRLLWYAASRWGASPALLSWELINEMDLAKFDRPEDMDAWNTEMASYLKSVDVHGHLVTTSVSKPNFQPDIWRKEGIDFVSIHGYGTEVGDVIYDNLAPFNQLNKPRLLAEFGGGWRATDDLPDKEGARLRDALWLTACSPSCGMALPWWWDTYIEARNLYPVLAAAGRFVAGDDRRERFHEWVRKTYAGGIEVWGILDEQGARLYVHCPGWISIPESRGDSLLPAPLLVELSGMMPGSYKLQFWDSREGAVFSTAECVARDGRLEIKLPAHNHEFAVKVDRVVRIKPELK